MKKGNIVIAASNNKSHTRNVTFVRKIPPNALASSGDLQNNWDGVNSRDSDTDKNFDYDFDIYDSSGSDTDNLYDRSSSSDNNTQRSCNCGYYWHFK